MLKKPSILLSCNCLHAFNPQVKASKTSSSQRPRNHQSCRYYAKVFDGHCRHDSGDIRWPEKTSANAVPSPYQIFNQKKGSPYSKQRFYELVKLYHPDRHDFDASMNGLSYATKLERYRLVVAANTILSDPVKRSAFDTYGAGWNGLPDVSRYPSDQSASWGGYNGRGWGNDPHGPSQNATWEDWEKWYARDANGPQEPRFVSNTAFVALIVLFATLGGIGQATRVGNYSMSFLEQRDALHDSASKDLIRRRREATELSGNREERIHSFLRQRDPVGYGITDAEYQSYRKLLPTAEVCSSQNTKSQPVGALPHKDNPKDG